MTEVKALSGRARVNCEIPADYDLNVNVGEQVTAGLTVIARKRKTEAGNEDQEHAEA